MVSLTPANPSDFLEIAALDRMAWSENRNSEYIPDGEHVWRLWCEHALVFCARDNNVLAGAILAFPTLSDAYCLHKVFVKEPQRGKGLGTLLVQELLREVDVLGVNCFLTVDPVNENAIRLYETWGFTHREFVKGFYREHEDRFLLTRMSTR